MTTRPHRKLMETVRKATKIIQCDCAGIPCLACQERSRIEWERNASDYMVHHYTSDDI